MKIKISNGSLILYFLIFCLIKPPGIDYISPKISVFFYGYLGYVCMMICVLLWLLTARKKGMQCFNFWSIALICYVAYIVLNTVVRNGQVLTCLSSWMKVVVFCMLVDAYSHNLVLISRVTRNILRILMAINLIFILLYPNGMYEMSGYNLCWILGYKSSIQYYALPMLVLTITLASLYKNKTLLVIDLLLIHFNAFLSQNMMLFIGLIVFDILYFLKLYKNTVIFNARNYLIIITVVNVLALFFSRIIVNYAFVYNLLTNVLGKMRNILIRINLWSTGIEEIGSHLFTGYGYITGKEMTDYFGLWQYHFHNQYLMTLMESGLIGSIIFAIPIIITTTRLYKNRNSIIAQYISLVFFVTFLCVIVEIFTRGEGYLIWSMIFLLGAYCKKFEEQIRQNYR